MIWLCTVVLFLQIFFHWIIQPATELTTPFFELDGLGIVSLVILALLISGKTSD
tara:strand:+ start:330 stop:491 length:162 start_codon:yes stop_codon:yes gene_type:complete